MLQKARRSLHGLGRTRLATENSTWTALWSRSSQPMEGNQGGKTPSTALIVCRASGRRTCRPLVTALPSKARIQFTLILALTSSTVTAWIARVQRRKVIVMRHHRTQKTATRLRPTLTPAILPSKTTQKQKAHPTTRPVHRTIPSTISIYTKRLL